MTSDWLKVENIQNTYHILYKYCFCHIYLQLLVSFDNDFNKSKQLSEKALSLVVSLIATSSVKFGPV